MAFVQVGPMVGFIPVVGLVQVVQTVEFDQVFPGLFFGLDFLQVDFLMSAGQVFLQTGS